MPSGRGGTTLGICTSWSSKTRTQSQTRSWPGSSGKGYDVSRVATGEDALEAPPGDLVLLDLRLPDIDSLDVCKQLRERSRIPIIVLTARGRRQTGSWASSWAPTTTSSSRTGCAS